MNATKIVTRGASARGTCVYHGLIHVSVDKRRSVANVQQYLRGHEGCTPEAPSASTVNVRIRKGELWGNP